MCAKTAPRSKGRSIILEQQDYDLLRRLPYDDAKTWTSNK
jgi:hypothetical protein